MNRYLGAVLAVVLSTGLARAQASSAELSAMTNTEVALLTVIGGGSPLTQAERRQAAQIVALAMRSEPQRWMQLDRNGRRVLQRLAEHDPVYAATLRESSRANAAFPRAGDPEVQMESAIITAHDPVVAIDPAHRQVVTEQTMLAVQRADAMMAARLGVPAPDAGFAAAERERIRDGFTRWDDKTRDAYVHAARNAAATEIFLTRFVNPQKISAYFAQVRQQVVAHPPMNAALTDYVVTQLLPSGYTVYRQRMSGGGRAPGGAAGAEALQLRWMQMKRAQQAVMCPPGATAGLCNPLP